MDPIHVIRQLTPPTATLDSGLKSDRQATSFVQPSSKHFPIRQRLHGHTMPRSSTTAVVSESNGVFGKGIDSKADFPPCKICISACRGGRICLKAAMDGFTPHLTIESIQLQGERRPLPDTSVSKYDKRKGYRSGRSPLWHITFALQILAF